MRVLVLEDEVVVSLDLSDMLADLGHETVGPFRKVVDAVRAIRGGESVDFALLDHSIGQTSSEAACEALVERGIPFAFVTGRSRDELPPPFADVALVSKPISRTVLEEALRTR